MSVQHSTSTNYRGDADVCSECGAAYQQPVGSGGQPASYYVAHHAWECSERKPAWPDHLRSMP